MVPSPPPLRREGMVPQRSPKELINSPKPHSVSPGDSPEGAGCRKGSAVRERGGGASGRETPAVNKARSCVFRGPEDGRRVFVFLEAAPRRLGSEGGSNGKRAESGEHTLRKPIPLSGDVLCPLFVRFSSRSVRFSSSRQAEKRASSLRCSSGVSLQF